MHYHFKSKTGFAWINEVLKNEELVEVGISASNTFFNMVGLHISV